MYKIEKNVPMPKSLIKFPLRDMEVGDSILVDGVSVAATRAKLSREAKDVIGKKFISISAGETSARIWRTS